MDRLSTKDLARVLAVTPGRISQLVGDGRLDGCYTGSGRARRFDVGKVADALGKRLDPGQMLGNGAGTKRALERIGEPSRPQESAELEARDPDRYELARTQKAEEEARRLRRLNAEADGSLVLAADLDKRVAQAIGQEIAQVESMLRDAARAIADRFGVDYREARQVLTSQWRTHRGARADALTSVATDAGMSDEERSADF